MGPKPDQHGFPIAFSDLFCAVFQCLLAEGNYRSIPSLAFFRGDAAGIFDVFQKIGIA